MSRREGFGIAIADGTRAVERGHYPPEALKYRMAVKGLMQSDPHDARILKAFALGLAVATRGMDHLRNRVTLEINARINDDPAFKERLYGSPVSAAPNSYEGKERAVRVCENTYAVGDSVGMCRFTTKLFNSPSLPGLEEFANQIGNVTGLEFSSAQLDSVGHNVMGVERLINARLGIGREHDTLPDRWFDEPIAVGQYAGERIDRAEFDAMLTRFYEVSDLDEQGHPQGPWRAELDEMLGGR
jgi:aldehyde:ferredoxin oxidoreductase